MIKEYKIISKNNLNMVVKSGSKIIQIPTVETESDIIFLDDINGKYTVVNSKDVKKDTKKENTTQPVKENKNKLNKKEVNEINKTDEKLVENKEKVVDM